jgi:hypothetical protein
MVIHTSMSIMKLIESTGWSRNKNHTNRTFFSNDVFFFLFTILCAFVFASVWILCFVSTSILIFVEHNYRQDFVKRNSRHSKRLSTSMTATAMEKSPLLNSVLSWETWVEIHRLLTSRWVNVWEEKEKEKEHAHNSQMLVHVFLVWLID